MSSLVERLRALAKQQADVDGDPSFHRGRMLTESDTMYAVAANEIERLREALTIIADNNSWLGFSPAPIVERMRDIAREALSLHKGGRDGD